MASRREQRDLNLNPQLRPQARPVDTYHRPTEEGVEKPAGSEGLAQLAQALDNFGKRVDQFAQSEHKIYTEAEIKAGAEARNRNQGEFKKLVENGTIKAGASPWFKLGFETQSGRIAGQEYDTGLRTAWSQSPVRESDNPADLSTFMREYQNKFIANRNVNEAWSDGFNPMVERSHNNLSAQHVAHRQHEIERKVNENTFQEVSSLVAEEIYDRRTYHMEDSALREAKLQERGQIIGARLNAMVANGLSGSKANQIAVDSVVGQALDARDTDILRLLDYIPAGSGASVGGTRYAKEERLKAENYLRRQAEHEDELGRSRERWSDYQEGKTRAAEMQKREDKRWKQQEQAWDKSEKAEGIFMQLTSRVFDDPTKPLEDGEFQRLLRDLNTTDPKAVQAFVAWRKSYINGVKDIEEDTDAISSISQDIYLSPDSVDPSRIFNGVTNGLWKNTTALALYDRWAASKKEHKNPFLSNSVFKEIGAGLEAGIARDKMSILGITGQGAAAGSDARVELEMFARDWIVKNPQASESDFIVAMRDKSMKLFKDRKVFQEKFEPAITVDAEKAREVAPHLRPSAPAPKGTTPKEQPKQQQPQAREEDRTKILNAFRAAVAAKDAEAIVDALKLYPWLGQYK